MNILAIESSCDENSAAVIRDGKVESLQICTQTIHQQFGGVVPELAGRSHLELVDQLASLSLQDAGLTVKDIDLVAATVGPGLIGSLLVGMTYARGLALACGIPFRAMHHLESHLWSAELTSGDLPLPFLILLVSGGHTQLVLVRGLRDYEIVGSTLDDALGEAYDKVGKLVGLSFPAGAAIDQLAKNGNKTAFTFPVVMQDHSLDFSFSGLKTSVLFASKKLSQQELTERKADLLASFQSAALKSVMIKVRKAVESFHPRALIAAGGVAANSQLRLMFKELSQELGIQCHFPEIKHCGDNAAMIGYLAWKLEIAKIPSDPQIEVHPRWSLEALLKKESVQ